MSTVKNLGFAALVVLSAACTPACGGASPPQFVHGERINKSTFNGDWPVMPESSVLACDSSKGDAVTFSPTDSNTVYAVNGLAVSWGKTEGWPNAKGIWNGENWGSFIDAGLNFCGK